MATAGCRGSWIPPKHTAWAARTIPKPSASLSRRPAPVHLLPGDDLRTALNRFSEARQETLPVIDNLDGRRVIGYLSEAYALRRYAHELERHRGSPAG